MKIRHEIAANAEIQARQEAPAAGRCVSCGAPATEMVEGDPSCELHVQQVWENHLEDYAIEHVS